MNTWYFIVIWHDSVNDTINIQVNNGAVDTLAHTTGVFSGTAPFRIGQHSDTSYMDGRVDAVGWWKGVLTQLERTQAYNDALGFQTPFPNPSTFTEPVTVVTQSCDQFTGMVKEIVLPRFAGEANDPEAIAKFLDEQAEILEDKYNGQVAREIPCDLCVENGAVIFDCGRCIHFEVAADADINSISFINCFPGDKIDALFRASKDIEISGWPSDLTCPSCGTALSPIKLAAGTILARPIEFAGGGNPVSKSPLDLTCVSECINSAVKTVGFTFNTLKSCWEGCTGFGVGAGVKEELSEGETGGSGGGGDTTGTCQCTAEEGSALTVAVCTEMDCEAAEPKVEITACGGTAPYTWSVVGGETPTQTNSGTSSRNTKVEPPTNTTPGEAGDAYARGHAQIRTDAAAESGCALIVQQGAVYNCAGVRTAGCTQRSISDIGVMPARCESASVNPNPCGCRPEVPCESACGQPCESEGGCSPCEQATVNLRTAQMITNGCKPCAATMEGMIVTVTDSVGDSVSTVVRT